MDFFTDSYYEVKLEQDLTIQKQYLDLLILKKSEGKPPPFLPDGLENMGDYNLISYKSLRQPLDAWMIDELIGYYTIYRKQISPSPKELVPIERFQLYAVCTRYSHFLSRGLKNGKITKIKEGLYEMDYTSRPIRIIVLNTVPTIKKNAVWQLFSGTEQGFTFGNKHYHWHEPKSKELLNPLYKLYKLEGVVMYTLDDYYREYTIPFIESLPPEIRVKGLSVEEVLEPFSPEERLKGLKDVSVEDRLKDVPVEVLKKYLSKHS